MRPRLAAALVTPRSPDPALSLVRPDPGDSDHHRSAHTLGVSSSTGLACRRRRITVIPLAADPRFHRPVAPGDRVRARRRHGLDGPYVFYVGGWEERKNVPLLVRGFAAAGPGGRDTGPRRGTRAEQAAMAALVRSCGVAERVRLLGWVEDEDLPALYAEALGFVYPSRHEGFGLQACEAMAVGCPTLAARATALPEVLGTAACCSTPTGPTNWPGCSADLPSSPASAPELAQSRSGAVGRVLLVAHRRGNAGGLSRGDRPTTRRAVPCASVSRS